MTSSTNFVPEEKHLLLFIHLNILLLLILLLFLRVGLDWGTLPRISTWKMKRGSLWPIETASSESNFCVSGNRYLMMKDPNQPFRHQVKKRYYLMTMEGWHGRYQSIGLNISFTFPQVYSFLWPWHFKLQKGFWAANNSSRSVLESRGIIWRWRKMCTIFQPIGS